MRILTTLTLAGALAAAAFAAPASARPGDALASGVYAAPAAYASHHRGRVVVRQVHRPPVVVRHVYRHAPVYHGYRPVTRTICRVRTRMVRVGHGYYVPRKVRVCTRRY